MACLLSSSQSPHRAEGSPNPGLRASTGPDSRAAAARAGERAALTAMTLTKVVLPEYCSPTSVSSISSFQKSERNQSSRREMSASMMAAGRVNGRAGGRTAAAKAPTRAGLSPDPSTAPRGRGAPLADTGGRRRPKPGSRAGHMTRPTPHARPRATVGAHGKSDVARPARRVYRLQRHLLEPPCSTAYLGAALGLPTTPPSLINVG